MISLYIIVSFESWLNWVSWKLAANVSLALKEEDREGFMNSRLLGAQTMYFQG